MKRIAIVLAGVMITSAFPAQARASAPLNWALITLTAGARGASGPVVIGASAGWWPRTGPLMAGYALDHAQGASVRAWHSSGGEYRFFSSIGGLRPAEKARYVVFFPGGVLRGVPKVVSKPSKGSWTVAVSLRTGARTIALASAEKSTGSFAGDLQAGTYAHTERVRTGIIGTQVMGCNVCAGSWVTPDGRSSKWISHANPNDALPTNAILPSAAAFRGPAGSWTWSYDGSVSGEGAANGSGEPVLAVIVPVGDLWKSLGA